MKEKVLIACVVFLVWAPIMFAESDSWLFDDIDLHGTLSSSWMQRYLGLRVSRVLYDKPMLWTDLYLDLPNGFFVDALWSLDLQDDELSSSRGDEFDPTIGYKWKMGDLDASVSATMFNTFPLRKWWDGNVWAQDFSLSRSFSFWNHTISPEFRIGYISKTKDFDEGALYLLPNIKHSWKNPLGIRGLTFSQTIMLAWDDGFDPPGNDSDGVFLRWTSGLGWKVGENTTLVAPSFTLLTPIRDSNDGRGEETSLGFSLIKRF